MIHYHIHPLSHDNVMELMRLLSKIDGSKMDEVTHLVKNADLGVKLTVDKIKGSAPDSRKTTITSGSMSLESFAA